MFTVVAVASSAILVVVQLASAQLTPRLIALVYRNRVRKFSISLFVFTFTFSVAVLVRIQISHWFFEDLTRGSGRRLFLQDADTGLGKFVLQEMARASSGSFFPDAESESEVDGICTQIALELRRQYTFAFYSSAAADSKWHTLRVRLLETRRRGFTLSYREGYVRN